jgi:hypothetical protein
VKQQLAPAIAWRFECERADLEQLVPPEVMISASSAAELEDLMNSHASNNVRAVMLAFGAAQHESERVKELLQPIVGQLRLLEVVGWPSMPIEFFERLMDANPTLVVCWYHADPRVMIPLARKHLHRFCLTATGLDATQAKNKLLAMNVDEATACKLVGTHLATNKLRLSALCRMVSAPLPPYID